MTDRPSPRPVPDHGRPRPRSGPADVAVATFVAAQRGRPAAYAEFVEHWDAHLRSFVHLCLGHPGATDTVLMTAYLRAYRSLPRFRADQTPGLWLHRIAFGSVVDEVRRRNRAEATARPSPNRSSRRPGSEPSRRVDDTLNPLGPLALDERALLVMVDLEGFTAQAVADAFGASTISVDATLVSARTAVLRSPGPTEGTGGTGGMAGTARTGGTDRSDGGVESKRPTSGTRRTDPAGILGRSLSARRAGSPLTPQPPATDPGSEGRPDDPAPRPEPTSADPGPAGRTDPFAVPAWMSDESVVLHVSPKTITASGSADSDHDEQVRVREVLASLVVPTADQRFWGRLGRVLLDERARQEEVATPDPSPQAGLPGEPALTPVETPTRSGPRRRRSEPTPSSVVTIADRAERTRPPRRWGPVLAVAGIAVAIVAAIAIAIAIGVSEPVPDGTTTAASFAEDLAAVFDSSPILVVQATVEDPEGGSPPQPFEVTVASSGSWSARRTDAFEVAAYDASTGTAGRFALTPGQDGAPALALAASEAGLAAGAPDPAPTVPDPIAALRDIGPLLREAGDRRLVPTSEGGIDTWSFRRRVSGPGAPTEQWLVVFGRDDALPRRVERREGDRVTSRITFESWKPASDLEGRSFAAEAPAGTPTSNTDHGFLTTDLDAVALLGRGQAVTPAWLPEGFELATVTVRGRAPFGAEPTGSGANPPDVGVASVAYQRGPERITVSVRDAGGRGGDWTDPFEPVDGSTARTRTLGDGRYNQAQVQLVTEPAGRTHLWTVSEDTVITVGGDLTSAEALRVAASLR